MCLARAGGGLLFTSYKQVHRVQKGVGELFPSLWFDLYHRFKMSLEVSADHKSSAVPIPEAFLTPEEVSPSACVWAAPVP